MGYRVTIQPGGYTFVVQNNETILAAALRCGYFFPHHCRMGICGTCKGKIITGEVDYHDAELFALSPEEQHQGYALFCCAYPLTDIIINVADVASIQSPLSFAVSYQVTDYTTLQNDITCIQLSCSESSPIHYQAGQYVKIIHPDESISPMSIACAPFDVSKIELHLYHPKNNLHALDLLRLVKTERKLLLRGAYGSCTLAKINLDQPLIFIANGTGLAPIKAIIEELLLIKKLPPIYLYWYAENHEFLYLQTTMEAWQRNIPDFHFQKISAGFLADIVLQQHADISACQVYMVDAEYKVYDTLFSFMRYGLPLEHFYSDVF
jgi:CDP-4-dehydro-6-deoxyglucose reductase